MAKLVRLLLGLAIVGTLCSGPLMTGRASAGEVPGEFACKAIEPMGILDLFNLVDDLDQASSTGEPVIISVWGPSLDTGQEISATERAEIEATLEAFISCVNQRDAMRILGLLSERYQSLLVMDLLGGADAISVMAEQIPVILDSPTASDPLQTPDIQRAWRQNAAASNIWAIVSLPIPGYTDDVVFFVAFTPGGDGWKIDDIARYEE